MTAPSPPTRAPLPRAAAYYWVRFVESPYWSIAMWLKDGCWRMAAGQADVPESRFAEIDERPIRRAEPAVTTGDVRALVTRIEALRAKATPGPYYQCGLPWFQEGSGVLAGNPDPHAGYMIIETESWHGERSEHLDNNPGANIADADDDAAYITALLNAWPQLAAAIARSGADHPVTADAAAEARDAALEEAAARAWDFACENNQLGWSDVVRGMCDAIRGLVKK